LTFKDVDLTVFKIQGQIFYQINTALYPASNEMPSYGQLFIVDNNKVTESVTSKYESR